MEPTDAWLPDKSTFKDEKGALRTQGLFLETYWDVNQAVYTFADEDKIHKGKLFKSLRKLYLETADPTEYAFAEKYFFSWYHWQRIVDNKLLLEKIQPIRDELEVKLRSEAVRKALDLAGTNFQAARWAIQGLWKPDTAERRGRPSAAERAKERELEERTKAALASDAERISTVIKLRGDAK